MNESQTRISFIDEFWELLGWDVRDHGVVQVETRVGSEKPDYRFLLNNKQTAFFVEAKKPSESLENPLHIFQAKSYAWSASVPVVVLTDFEEFRVFVVKSKPDISKPNYGLIKTLDFKFKDYEDNWAVLVETFSKDSVENGSLNKLAKKTKQELAISLDKEFLAVVSDWRVKLANNIALRNEITSAAELTEVVQRIIDRVVFLRILEDKGIEHESVLQRLHDEHSSAYYKSFVKSCERLKVAYNGLIFNKHEISENVIIDDSVFKSILKDIIPQKSPYKFDEVPVDILGKIYEDFLGYELRLTKAGRAKVDIERKDIVKKQGGVFYTPPHISREISQKTLFPLLEKCKTFDDVLNLKIADISCGSGSFIIAAFDVVCNWVIALIKKKPIESTYGSGKNKKELIFTNSRKEKKLTLFAKNKIATSCFYGMDLDLQAVEVTQLSIFLKILEDYGEEPQLSLSMSEALLPKLERNIYWGNSLVEDDYINDEFFEYSTEKKRRLRPTCMEEAFPFLIDGGFAVIIGNPPYILLEDAYRDDKLLKYFRDSYHIAKYKLDTYHLFIFRSIKLLAKDGYLGYITPSNYATNNGIIELRKYILENTQLVEFGFISGQVFEDASVDTAITILKKKESSKIGSIVKYENSDNSIVEMEQNDFDQVKALKSQYMMFKAQIESNINESSCVKLNTEFTVSFGMQLRNRKVFVDDVGTDDKITLSKKHVKCYTGSDINEYTVTWNGLYCLEDPKIKCGGCWDLNKHHYKPKVLVRQIGMSPVCGIDELGYNCLNTLFMLVPINNYSPYLLLGILNTELLKKYWTNKFSDERKTFPKIKGTYLEQLPIPVITNTNKALAKNIESNVQKLLVQLRNQNKTRDHLILIKNIKSEIENDTKELYKNQGSNKR